MTGLFYFGQTIQKFMERMIQHEKMKDNCKYLNRSIKKNGWENFSYGIIVAGYMSKAQLNKKEIFIIAKFNTCHGPGYNCKEGGEMGGRPNMDTRIKTRNSMIKANGGKIGGVKQYTRKRDGSIYWIGRLTLMGNQFFTTRFETEQEAIEEVQYIAKHGRRRTPKRKYEKLTEEERKQGISLRKRKRREKRREREGREAPGVKFKKKVKATNLTTNKVHTFDSIKDASGFTNVSACYISRIVSPNDCLDKGKGWTFKYL